MNNKTVKNCVNRYCPKMVLRQEKLINKVMQKLKQKHKTIKIKSGLGPTEKKKLLERCKTGYCNPSCKNTIFESGSNISQKLKKNITKKGGLPALKFITQMRKNIFKTKKNVLQNNFYEKLSKKNINSAKKDGAISGCTLQVL